MPAVLADFSTFDDVDQPLNAQWVVMSRCLQALTPYFQAKIATGTEPLDALAGMYLAVDGQSTTFKDWRLYVNSANAFSVDENTGTDAVPVWTNRLLLPLGGGFVSAHAASHQHGGTDEVATSTPAANAILKALGTGQIATGWLTGVVRDAEIAAAAGIAVNKLAALTASRLVLTDSSGFLTVSAALTASRALETNASGLPVASAVTSTELGRLSGVTSAVQTQLDSKLNLSGGVLSGNLDLDGHSLIVNAAGTTTIDDNSGTLRFVVLGTQTLIVTGASSTAIMQMQMNDDGAGLGPVMRLMRVSATPAASDLLGSLEFYGRDSGAADQLYGRIDCQIVDPTAASEDAVLRFFIPIAGTTSTALEMRSTGLRLALNTATTVPYIDANKDLVSSAVTPTELGYLSGVTSAIQTQINSLSSGSGLKFLNLYSPSGASSVDINSTYITGTYARYLITYRFTVSTDDTEILIRTSSDNGTTVDAGASDYSYAGSGAGTSTGLLFQDAANDSIVMNDVAAGFGVGNASTEQCVGMIWLLYKGNGTLFPTIYYESTWLDPSTRTSFATGIGHRRGGNAINFIRLLPGAGTFSGAARLYGISDS